VIDSATGHTDVMHAAGPRPHHGFLSEERLFIHNRAMDPHQTTNTDDHYQHGMRVSVIGLIANALLVLIKLLAGLLGHSYALVADAVESTADIFSSFVVWGGLRIAARPADENHPYGHGKAEALAGLFVALMLYAAAIGIAVQAVREIITPHRAPAAFTLWTLIGVVIVKEGLFRLVSRTARVIESGAVLSDAWHHRSDAITSLAAGVGISVALLGGPAYAAADDWAALFASGIILINATRIIRRPVRELMDAEPTTAIIDNAREVARSVDGVEDVEKIFARKSGLTYWIDMHIEVDPEMTVHHAHDIAHDVQEAIRRKMSNIESVLVHIEPAPRQEADTTTAKALQQG